VKAVVVEDRGTFGPALVSQLVSLGVSARWVAHPVALDLSTQSWADLPLLLIDALDLSSQQDDHTRSRLASLDLLDRVATLPADRRPRVVVYSTHMARPEVNIPLRGPGVVTAHYDAAGLLDNLAEVVMGRYPDQVAPPTPRDFARLHPQVPPSADVAAVHQLMRTHDRAWRQVWDAAAAFDRAAQTWIRRNILELLGAEDRGYSVAIQVTRKVAGLPYAGL
jgi:hypothetical protein